MKTLLSKILSFILLNFIVIDAVSQSDMNEVRLVRPEVASLHTALDLQNDLYTGGVNITVPIYTINDGDLNLPINLIYNAKGIRLHDDAGKVGLGWSLSIEQAIFRTIKGLPDDFIRDGKDGIDVNLVKQEVKARMNEGFRYSGTVNAPNIQVDHFLKPFMYLYEERKIDIAPDEYNYKCLSGTGTIIEDLIATNMLHHQSSSNISIDRNKFILKDELGYTYDYSYDSESNNVELLKSLYGKDDQISDYYENVWHISKIYSPNKLRNASFKYETVKRSNIHPITTSSNLPIGIISEQVIGSNEYINSYCDYDHVTLQKIDQEGTITSRNYRVEKRLSEITTPNYKVEFICNGNMREDLQHNNRIDGIKVYLRNGNTNKLIKHIELKYDYFECGGYSNSILDQKRLRLSSIEEHSVNGNQKKIIYSFNYTTDYLIQKSEKAMDYWGYMNEECYGELFPSNYTGKVPRHTNKESVKWGMLNRIENELGGVTELEWEANTYSYIRNSQITEPDQEFINANKGNVSVYGHLNKYNPAITTESFDIIGTGGSVTISARGYYPDYNPNVVPPFEIHPEPSEKHKIGEYIDQTPIILILKDGFQNQEFKQSYMDNPLTEENGVLHYIFIDEAMMNNYKTKQISISRPGKYWIRILRGYVAENLKYLVEDPQKCCVSADYYSYKSQNNDKYNHAGGCRIKSIKEFDGEKYTLKNYFYEGLDGISWGVLADFPVREEGFTEHIGNVPFEGVAGLPWDEQIKSQYSKIRRFALPESRSGEHIGYKTVHEEIYIKPRYEPYYHLRSTKTSYFSSNYDTDCQDIDECVFHSQNTIQPISSFGANFHIGSPTSMAYKRGLLREERISTVDGPERREMVGPIEIRKYNYTFDTEPEKSTDYIPSGIHMDLADRIYNEYMPSNNGKLRAAVIAIGRFRLIKYRKMMRSETVTTYPFEFKDGIKGTDPNNLYRWMYPPESEFHLSNKLEYTYENKSGFVPKPLRIKRTINESKDIWEEDHYTYTNGKPKSITTYRNNIPLRTTQYTYDDNNHNLIKIESGVYNNGNFVMKTNKEFNYLSSYLVMERTNDENYGTTNYYWQDGRLIAKTISNKDLNGINPEIVRNMDNAFVESYIYDSEYADKVKEVLDSNGKTMRYEYDIWGRLITIKDENSNIIKHYRYKLQKDN